MEEFEDRFSTEIFLPRPDEAQKRDQLEQSIQNNARFLRESSSQIPATFQKERIKVRRRISERIKRKSKSKKPVSDSDPNPIQEHKYSLEELGEKCETSIDAIKAKHSKGLTSEEAEAKLAKYGPNSLTPKKGTPMWVIFLRQFSGFLPVLLQIGGVLCFIAYILDPKHIDNLYLGIILWFEVIMSGIFSFLQEKKSAGVLEGFSKLAAQSANVIRNGKVGEVDAKTLVVGDIVIVKAGDRVPADIRIIFSNGLKVDNSSLTGEGEPQSRLEKCTDESYLETKNLAFYGTLCQDGEALGVVIRTGDNTVLGRIAKLASKPKDTQAALEIEITKFIRIVTVFALVLGVLFIVMGFVNKLKWIIVIIFTIGIVVAQVPEGLLPTITVAMTLIAKKLAKKNVLVKSPAGIETLGSCTTIASDKTGTLTQNRMTVVHLWYDGTICSTDTILDTGKFDEKSPTFKEFYNIMALCNRAVFDDSDQSEGDRKIIGDASESAILKFTESVHSVADYRAKNPKLFEIPFNSVNKWQLSVHSKPDKSIHLLIKGAPERIIDKCSHIMREGTVIPMTDIHRSEFTKAYELFASRGERVLGFASLELDTTIYPEDYKYNVDNPNFPTGEYVFVGLTGLMDPPKDTVPGAIETCKEAGIRVVMVTGDHPLTAVSIAKQIGIIQSDVVDDLAALRRHIMENDASIEMDRMSTDRRSMDRKSMEGRISIERRASMSSDNRISIDMPRILADLQKQQNGIVIKGSEIDDLNELEWDYILARRQIVFARTSPEQKYQIVENCQKRGEIVAVTGDGVNDSPALKKANLGCAMGISGNEVSKDAADVILLDDNFSSIVLGVEQGRIVFDNLRKAIAYTLSSNSCELLPFLAYLILRMPLGLTPILVLLINLGTDLLTAISFAYESAEAGIMKRRPRSKKERLVTLKLAVYSYIWLGSVQAIAGFANYFVVFADYNIPARDLVWLDLSYFEEDAEDFHGYNATQQRNMLKEAQTAFFVGIVLTRVALAIVCKTRRTSVFKHGFRNKTFNIGLILEIVICVMAVYVPGIVDVFGTRPPTWKIWVISLPIIAFVIVIDEIRKFLIRRYPYNKIIRAFYW